MHGYPGYHPQQYPNQQAMVPWPQPQVQQLPTPAMPATLEGTALAGTLGAGAAALVTEGIMFLGNVRPSSVAVNAGITLGSALFGGTAAALGYRVSANRHYEAAKQAAGMTGVSPQSAAGALRLSGRLGKWGMEINVPTQSITEAAKAWNSIMNPENSTPDIVNEYFRRSAEHAAEMAAQGFVSHMPPPFHIYQQQYPQYGYPPQYAPPPPPPGFGQANNS